MYPHAASAAPGLAPDIQVKLSVLRPSEKTQAFRHNATEVNGCTRSVVPSGQFRASILNLDDIAIGISNVRMCNQPPMLTV